MTKQQYKRARRMIRDNGRSAYAWIARQCGGDWTLANALRDLADAQDGLAERADIVAWCKLAGVAVNARQTSRNYRVGAA